MLVARGERQLATLRQPDGLPPAGTAAPGRTSVLASLVLACRNTAAPDRQRLGRDEDAAVTRGAAVDKIYVGVSVLETGHGHSFPTKRRSLRLMTDIAGANKTPQMGLDVLFNPVPGVLFEPAVGRVVGDVEDQQSVGRVEHGAQSLAGCRG